jgi:lipopolysaccharide biosynthesis glycosyltransferase
MFERKTIVISFNQEYIKYAAAYIDSVLSLNPEWDVNCIAVNVNNLKHYPWTDSRVKITYSDIKFEENKKTFPANKKYYYDPEKCYMTTCRFNFLDSLTEKYDLLVLTDVDCIAVFPFSTLLREMSGMDIGLVKTTNTEPSYAVYSAACVAFNTHNLFKVREWLKIWKTEIENLETYFFNDQQAIYNTVQKCKLNYQNLDANSYCSFKNSSEAVLVMTAGRIKETRSNDYNYLYQKSWDNIELKRRSLWQTQSNI